jgi:predicted phosphodiesterase
MRRAILSDIHGNLEALEAVLADVQTQQVEEIYCLGDIVGYGPNPRECIDRVMTFSMVVLGNHDQGALFDPEGFSSNAERAIFWTREQLESGDGPDAALKRWDFLAELPRAVRQPKQLFVHGSPRNPLNEYVFPEDVYNTKKLEKLFSLVDHVSFQGHTHVPGVFTDDFRFYQPSDIGHRFTFGPRKAMVNVGSVGQPRDNDPRSCYVLLTDDTVEFRRIAYPFEQTAEKIYAIPELDNFLGDRLRDGR